MELVESDWDLQHLLRLMVTSKTFRQSSHVSPSLLERDPQNELLARAPRFRLPAWMIRDHALAASGLLNAALGGPPVKPWQPEGVWKEIFMGRFTYRPSVGPAQYRRTLYAYWRRSSAPTFLFDSAQRRVCEVGIRRTNTPLHALTLLNDTTMFEASRQLALTVSQEESLASAKPEEKIQWISRRILSRALEAAELEVVHREWRAFLNHYRSHPEEARTYVTKTLLPLSAPEQPAFPQIAALTLTASLVFNLDEAMTHE